MKKLAHPQSFATTIQRKANQPAGRQTRAPQAPPPYRPQPAPKCLQLKAASVGCRPPAAPPTPHPQPAAGALQRKAAPSQKASAGQAKTAPAAPPVYRPQPTPRVLQPKARAGEPPQRATGGRAAWPALTTPPHHPSGRPSLPPVIQRMMAQGRQVNWAAPYVSPEEEEDFSAAVTGRYEGMSVENAKKVFSEYGYDWDSITSKQFLGFIRQIMKVSEDEAEHKIAPACFVFCDEVIQQPQRTGWCLAIKVKLDKKVENE